MFKTDQEWEAFIQERHYEGMANYEQKAALARQQATSEYNAAENPVGALQDLIDLRVAMLDAPPTLDELRHMYDFMKPQELPVSFMPAITPVVPFYDAIFKLGDRYWNVAEAKWVSAPADDSNVIVLGGEPTEQNLRETLKLYSKRDPRIHLGPEIMDTEELFTRLRARRDERLSEYDVKIAQLDRQIRLNPEYAAYSLSRAAWDEYAVALCDLPAQSGAPWDGGGVQTPWPNKPE